MTRIGVVSAGPVAAADVARAVDRAGGTAVVLPPPDLDLGGLDAVILTGAPADHEHADALRAPLARAAEDGLPILGLGDGFGLLCELGLLPGSVEANAGGTFLCRDAVVRVESRDTVWSCAFDEGQDVTLVLATAAARYRADDATLARVEAGHQVVLRHTGTDPAGSARGIAGLTNERGNVVGLAVQPAYCIDALTGPSVDGLLVFGSVLTFAAAAS